MRWFVIGLGLGLNCFLAFGSGLHICTTCRGLNAILAFPWPWAGIAFWLGAAFLRRWQRAYALIGFIAGLCLLSVGLWATGKICVICLTHLVLLGLYAGISFKGPRREFEVTVG